MRKFIIFNSILFVMALLLVSVFQRVKLPSISLPKGAQHNTFGELPVVEAMDDGDFYEKDGSEENARAEKIQEKIEVYEQEYRDCLDRITGKCGEGSEDKYVYKYYSYLPRAVYEENPDYEEREKPDNCREKQADKCYKKLEKKAEFIGYWFRPTTGFVYFKSHGDNCDEEWLSCEDSYMGSFAWAPKKEDK